MAEDDFDDTRARSRASSAADAAALASAFGSAGSSDEAREYLAKQSALVDLQMENFRLENENLRKLDEYEVSHLRWRRFNDQMRGALQIVLVIVGFAILVACGAAVWNASQAEGLVVDAFSVPPQYAQKGMGGDTVADDLTQKVAAVRDSANANSIAHSQDVKNERDEEIKVDIPDTGISLGEVARYLRSWLGHERHLSGSLRDAGDGRVTLTVALDGANAMSFTGAAADLDKLEQQAAEHVFQSVDPSNYILYLWGEHRPPEESLAAIRYLVGVARTPGESSDGYALWGSWMERYKVDMPAATALLKTAAAIDPKALPPVMELSFLSDRLGREEDELRWLRRMPSFRQDEQYAWREGEGFRQVIESGAVDADRETGDFAHAVAAPCGICSPSEALLTQGENAARDHNGALAARLIAEAAPMDSVNPADMDETRYFAAVERGDWQAAAASGRALSSDYNHLASAKEENLFRATYAMPLVAVALAHIGYFPAAHRALDMTPGDCDRCMVARGDVDALEGKSAAAAWWYARTIDDAPSIPFAYTNWGAMLLGEGRYDAAIGKFESANRKGPHFADPLEMWGEVLIRENRSDLALAKFSEAARYAPNWGRLHLKWGEALLWAGKSDDAKKQFGLAAGLDLTPAERSELAKVSHG